MDLEKSKRTKRPVGHAPEWIRPGDVRPIYGISRSRIYELIRKGTVESKDVRLAGSSRGIRLIRCESIRRYIEEA